jgi:5-methylcytosine-specific restriction endonuclease McrA
MNIQLGYNKKTYGSHATYARFVQAVNDGEAIPVAMRHVWVGKNHRTGRAGHDAMLAICGEKCANPRCGRVLDYSLGGNIKGKKKAPDTQPSLDHIMPTTRGGADSIENYQVLCTPCNTAKNAMWGQEDAERLRGLADMIQGGQNV